MHWTFQQSEWEVRWWDALFTSLLQYNSIGRIKCTYKNLVPSIYLSLVENVYYSYIHNTSVLGNIYFKNQNIPGCSVGTLQTQSPPSLQPFPGLFTSPPSNSRSSVAWALEKVVFQCICETLNMYISVCETQTFFSHFFCLTLMACKNIYLFRLQLCKSASLQVCETTSL